MALIAAAIRHTPNPFQTIAVLIVLSSFCADLRAVPDEQSSPAAIEFAPTKLNMAHLPNAMQVHRKVISGGLPSGDEGFRQLASLNVETVISVDGAKPDL